VIFTYRMVLGDFDTGDFGEVAVPLVMTFWFLCTVFNMIVMLNLLIAIISDSYARVTGNAEIATFQEKASMISENCFLIPTRVKKHYAENGKYLVIAQDADKIEGDETTPVERMIHSLRTELN
jgi:hypothetical protein